MTRVDFYVLSEQSRGDRYHLTCRLADTIYRRQRRIYIHTESDAEARHLDRLLWTFQQSSFVPHGLISEVDALVTPILIGTNQEPEAEDDVLINLAGEIPNFFSRFDRVAELIDHDPTTRETGRERFRFYRDRGFPLKKHDIKL